MANKPKPMMSYAEVDEITRANQKLQAFALDNAVLEYLGSEKIRRVSDEALARYSTEYRLDRISCGPQIVAVIAEEQERRRRLAAARAEAMASKNLSVSRLAMWAAIVAAVVSVAAFIFHRG